MLVQESKKREVQLPEVPEARQGGAEDDKSAVAVGELGKIGLALRLEEADEDAQDEDGRERRGRTVLQERQRPLRPCVRTLTNQSS